MPNEHGNAPRRGDDPEPPAHRDGLLDDVARILASPLPRRAVFRMAVGGLLAAALAPLLPGRSALAQVPLQGLGIGEGGLPLSDLSTPVKDFSSAGEPADKVVDALRSRFGFPVHFIDAGGGPGLDIKLDEGTVRDVLDRLVALDPRYRWVEVASPLAKGGRKAVVVLPKDGKYDTPVSGSGVNRVPRQQAIDLLLSRLQGQVPGFEAVTGLLTKGSTRSPIFTAPVTLRPRATVLEHLVDIASAGDNPTVLSIRETRNPGRFVVLVAGMRDIMVESGLVDPSTALVAAGLLKGGFLSQAAPSGGAPQGSAPAQIAAADNGAAPACAPKCRAKSVTYANQRNLGCGRGSCGASIVFDITGITVCPGDNCKGKKLTESVTTDEGCIPGGVNTGAGCPIGDNNTITGCTDTYSLCAAPAAFPAAGCTEKYTQKLYVDGKLVQTCTITFKITKTATSCSGTVTRSCTNADVKC